MKKVVERSNVKGRARLESVSVDSFTEHKNANNRKPKGNVYAHN